MLLSFQGKSELLCPGIPLQIDCDEAYSGSKEVECIAGNVIVVKDLCIADWINNVDSMVSKRNVSWVK